MPNCSAESLHIFPIMEYLNITHGLFLFIELDDIVLLPLRLAGDAQVLPFFISGNH